MNVVQELVDRDVELVCKSESRLMRLIDKLLFWNKDFMKSFWTTITLPGYRKIFYPTTYSSLVARYKIHTIRHELEHVRQADGPINFFLCRWAWNIGFSFFYLCLFFPVFLAYFRMRWETDAYAVGYVSRARTHANGFSSQHREEYANWVAHALWTSYAWAWPKAWTKNRFLRRVDALQRRT